MSNPWTKKNPLMSMWLSAANKAVGSARGQVTAAAKKEVATAQTHAAQQVIAFWTGAAPSPRAKKKSRRR